MRGKNKKSFAENFIAAPFQGEGMVQDRNIAAKAELPTGHVEELTEEPRADRERCDVICYARLREWLGGG